MTRAAPLFPRSFIWAVGIEDTSIGVRIRHSGNALDELELTQHYRFFREDIDRAASLGVDAIRYGIPWYRVEPAPGRFDWGWVDEALGHASASGLTVIADLVHYGTPVWLEGSFADAAFPAAMGRFAGAFAERYRSIVRHYTPLNEPTVTAMFCGERGLWPPYLTGTAGWIEIVLQTVAGIRAAISEIRRADSRAVIVHVEAAKPVHTDAPELRAEAAIRRARAFLPTDLLMGDVGPDHPLREWLKQHGVTAERLDKVLAAPARIDAMGVNYYPDLSPREIVRHDGRVAEVALSGGIDGLIESVRDFATRYGLPTLVAETGIDGSAERRAEWLSTAGAAVARLHESDPRVVGFTWWPLFDFVDWSHAAGDEVVEEFLVREVGSDGVPVIAMPFQPGLSRPTEVNALLRPMGLWSLHATPDGTLEREPTEAVAVMQRLAERPRAPPSTTANTAATRSSLAPAAPSDD